MTVVVDSELDAVQVVTVWLGMGMHHEKVLGWAERGGAGQGWVDWPPSVWGAAGFLGGCPKRAGLQWSFSKRDYCIIGQSGTKFEKGDYSSTQKKERLYLVKKEGL